MGETATILKDAAVAAIKSGEERITLKAIRKLKFVRPSTRRKPPTAEDEDEDETEEGESEA